MVVAQSSSLAVKADPSAVLQPWMQMFQSITDEKSFMRALGVVHRHKINVRVHSGLVRAT